MKSTHKIKQLEHCKIFFKIEVPKDEMAVLYEEAYSQIRKDATLPGFRKGNAPFDLIKKNYAGYAKKKVLELALADSYRDALKASGLFPVNSPLIENVNFNQRGDLTFDATVEVRPQVQLKTYKGFKLNKKTAAVNEEDVNKALENLRQMAAQYKPVQARPVKEGDYLQCDIEWVVDGVSIDKRKNTFLPVEKNTLTADLFNGILGIVINEKKSISVNLDKDFPKKEYVGKTAIVEVLARQIKEKEIPVLSDDLAKDLGVKEGIDALRKNIKTHLEAEKQETVRLDMQDQLISQLLKAHSFELPASLIEGELNSLVEDAKHKLMHQGYSQKEDLSKALMPHAEKQVKAFFILEEIAEKEKLQAREEELESFIDQLAKRQGSKDTATLRKQLEHDNRINSLFWQLTEAKVMKFLMDNAKIEEE